MWSGSVRPSKGEREHRQVLLKKTEDAVKAATEGTWRRRLVIAAWADESQRRGEQVTEVAEIDASRRATDFRVALKGVLSSTH